MFDCRAYRLGNGAIHALTSLIAVLATTAFAQAQQVRCEQTPEGRICRVQQEITAGAVVGSNRERLLGLVTVNRGCSGTLMNRFWVLTARHCVTTNRRINGPLMAADALLITASWAPRTAIRPSEIRDFAVNIPTPATDIVMVYLGLGDLGPADTQLPFITQRGPTTANRWTGARLQTTDVVSQFGRGFSTFATGSFLTVPPNAVAAVGGGTYFTATFRPSSVSEAGYELQLNAGQVGHGGDSGGPTLVFDGDRRFVAGVQSTCTPTGYVPGAPIPPGATNPEWLWATGISACQYVSVERFVREIGRNMQQRPECSMVNSCRIEQVVSQLLNEVPSGVTAIVDYVLTDTPPSPAVTLGVVGLTR